MASASSRLGHQEMQWGFTDWKFALNFKARSEVGRITEMILRIEWEHKQPCITKNASHFQQRVFPVVYVGFPSYFTSFLASRLRRSKGTTGSAGVAVGAGTLVAAKPVEAGGWEIINGDDATGLWYALCQCTFVRMNVKWWVTCQSERMWTYKFPRLWVLIFPFLILWNSLCKNRSSLR